MILALINAEFARLNLAPLDAEQIALLRDPSRFDEAIEMLDDWEARLGVSDYVRGEVAEFLLNALG